MHCKLLADLSEDMHICNTSDKTGHSDSLQIPSVNGTYFLTYMQANMLHIHGSVCRMSQGRYSRTEHLSTQHALALHNKRFWQIVYEVMSRYVTAMLLIADMYQAEDSQTAGCDEATLNETRSQLTAIAGRGSISWLAVLAHLQVCQAALAGAAEEAPHAWPECQVHQRMDGVVNGVHNKRDGCTQNQCRWCPVDSCPAHSSCCQA